MFRSIGYGMRAQRRSACCRGVRPREPGVAAAAPHAARPGQRGGGGGGRGAARGGRDGPRRRDAVRRGERALVYAAGSNAHKPSKSWADDDPRPVTGRWRIVGTAEVGG